MRRIKTIPCKLDKVAEGNFASLHNASIRDLNAEIASSILSRYYKGIGSHNENMVMEIWKNYQ